MKDIFRKIIKKTEDIGEISCRDKNAMKNLSINTQVELYRFIAAMIIVGNHLPSFDIAKPLQLPRGGVER